MRSFVLSAAALFTVITACGQVEYGFFAGPQATSALYSVNSVKQSTKYKYGFQAGLTLKVPFENKLYFAPALLYSMKGYKVNFTQFVYPPDVTAKDNDTRIHTIETAFLLQYDFNNDGESASSFRNHFFIKGGPTLDFQLFGHEKFNTMPSGSVSRGMKYGFDKYGHFSANAMVQLGLETGSGMMIFAQYSYGLANLNNADDGPKIRHQVFGISFGKYFTRKRLVK